MLIQITTKCSEGCPHCFIDSRPNGETMSLETLRKTIFFAHEIGATEILISGGEITEIPNFAEYLRNTLDIIREYYVGKDPNVILLSNGTFLLDVDKLDAMNTLLREYQEIREVQVSTAKEYYKSYSSVVQAYNNTPTYRLNLCDISGLIRIRSLGRA